MTPNHNNPPPATGQCATPDSCATRLELARQIAELESRVTTDALTGLWNRAHFDHIIEKELDRSLRHRQPLSLILLDIDNFKRINDAFGHQVGDRVLRELAIVANSAIRSSDALFRWGGEEFAVLFEGMPLDEARQLCEQLRARVQAIDCTEFAPGWSMTISAGVTERTGLAHHEKLVSRADALLYEAKRAGRNRICG